MNRSSSAQRGNWLLLCSLKCKQGWDWRFYELVILGFLALFSILLFPCLFYEQTCAKNICFYSFLFKILSDVWAKIELKDFMLKKVWPNNWFHMASYSAWIRFIGLHWVSMSLCWVSTDSLSSFHWVMTCCCQTSSESPLSLQWVSLLSPHPTECPLSPCWVSSEFSLSLY